MANIFSSKNLFKILDFKYAYLVFLFLAVFMPIIFSKVFIVIPLFLVPFILVTFILEKKYKWIIGLIAFTVLPYSLLFVKPENIVVGYILNVLPLLCLILYTTLLRIALKNSFGGNYED